MVSYWLQCASTLKLWPTRDNTFAYFRLEFDHHHALFTEFLWKDEKLRTAPDLFTVGKLSRLCPSQFILGLFGEQHCSRLNCKQTLPFHLFHLLHTIWHVETHPCLESSDGTARWVKLVDWMGRERPLPVQSVQSAWRAAQEALSRETTPSLSKLPKLANQSCFYLFTFRLNRYGLRFNWTDEFWSWFQSWVEPLSLDRVQT